MIVAPKKRPHKEGVLLVHEVIFFNTFVERLGNMPWARIEERGDTHLQNPSKMIRGNVHYSEKALLAPVHALAGTIMVRAYNQLPDDDLLQNPLIIYFDGISIWTVSVLYLAPAVFAVCPFDSHSGSYCSTLYDCVNKYCLPASGLWGKDSLVASASAYNH